MTKDLDALTVGETMVLFHAIGGQKLEDASTFSKHIGGAESTFSVALARLGLRVAWISRLGDDDFGSYVLRILEKEGVDCSRVILDPDRQTGVFFKSAYSGHDGSNVVVRYYRKNSAASLIAPSDLDASYIARARHVHLSGITVALSDRARQAALYAMTIAREAGATFSFDVNVRTHLAAPNEWESLVAPFIDDADIVFMTREEAKLITGHVDADRVGEVLLARGVGMIVVKDSVRGSHVYTRGASWFQPARQSRTVVQPDGAGDAFAAGVVAGHLMGWPPRESTSLGAVLGAAAVSAIGSHEVLPRLEEARELSADLSLYSPEGEKKSGTRAKRPSS